YLARCFQQQGQENGAENNWQRALEDAAGDVNKLLMLAEYAEKNDAERGATTAFEAAAVANPKSHQAQQGRFRIAYSATATKRAQDALAVYANLKVPSNAVSASAVAVHASVLAATGRKDEARAEIAKVPSNRLLPEEAMMVLPLRG